VSMSVCECGVLAWELGRVGAGTTDVTCNVGRSRPHVADVHVDSTVECSVGRDTVTDFICGTLY
jgi:hypothetical protein